MSGLIDAALDEDGALTASTTLPGERDVEVLCEPGEGNLSLSALREIAEDALRPLDQAAFGGAEQEILRELAAAGPGTEAPVLHLEGVVIEPGPILVLLYSARSASGESTVYCTLGRDLGVESIEVAEDEDPGVPTVELGSLDDLLDHLSAAPESPEEAPRA